MGELSYRQLGKKHEIDFRLIHSWVRKFQGKSEPKTKTQIQPISAEPLPTDVKTLCTETCPQSLAPLAGILKQYHETNNTKSDTNIFLKP
jgi:hypothetical protein